MSFHFRMTCCAWSSTAPDIQISAGSVKLEGMVFFQLSDISEYKQIPDVFFFGNAV